VKFIPAILAAGVAALIAAAPVSASAAAAAHTAARSPQQYCVVTVDKVHLGQAASQVALNECAASQAPRTLTRLVEFFQGVNYTGRNISLYSSAGPCTAVKFLLPNLRTVNAELGGITSYRLFSNCHFASYWWNTGFRGPKKGPVRGSNRYVGLPRAGHLWSMKIWA
jgi:hypothetical protein